MKNELQLIEECIEEKMKVYHSMVAQITSTPGGIPSSSFTSVEVIQQKQAVTQIRAEIDQLIARREILVCDTKEIEVIRGNREEIEKGLLDLPEGTYRLLKVEKKDDNE